MRGVGSLRDVVALYKRDPQTVDGNSYNAWEYIGTYAAEVAHLSQKAFAAASADWSETVVMIHLRTLRGKTLGAGLKAVHLGRAYKVVEAVPDRPMQGYTELRAVAMDMEGVGIT